jgi:hypothetical protein
VNLEIHLDNNINPISREKREARIRETNWSSKNGGFADGLVTLPRKIKVLIIKGAEVA